MSVQNALGRHVLVEMYDCNVTKLNDFELIARMMKDAAVHAGATIVGDVFHKFSPHGVSGAVVIAESHLSIHTWPEHNFAALDLFTCGESVDPWKAFNYIQEILEAKNVQTQEIMRGLFDHQVEHKPGFG